MAEVRKSPSPKAASAKRSAPGLASSKRRKHGASAFLQGDVTLTDKAYAQIEELIVTLQLPPGTVLSELVLADRLGIGRTPIREALQRLSRDGLVNILPRRGVLVSDIDLRSQLRLLEVRRELERLMARGAAERASDEERAQFAEIARGMNRASENQDDMAFMRLDQQFNTLVSLAARNEYASRSMGLMHALSRRFWYQHYKEAADLPLCARLHAAVAEAIARREPDKAADASDRLVDYIESFARSTL
jgi:DNA-binding GntR family transcriptional regulator